MAEITATETKLCDNCKKDVSAANYLTHSVHCHRNITLCKKCDQPFPKNEIASHLTEAHSKINCSKCGDEYEQQEAENHETQVCNKRLVKCPYCTMDVTAGDQKEHQDYCGSRTEKCAECGQYVMVKYENIHKSSNHQFLTVDDLDKNSAKGNGKLPTSAKKFMEGNAENNKSASSTRSRVSPGKRTNDMPQVNVNSSSNKDKQTEKPNLQELYRATDPSVRAGMSLEQLDRLIALHMAEDDLLSPEEGDLDPDESWFNLPNRYRLTSAEDFDDYNPDVANHWNPLLASNTRPERDQTLSFGREFVNFADDRRIGGNKREPEPPPEDESPTLPCEFCGELFFPEILLEHQEFCENSSTRLNQQQHNNVRSPIGTISAELNNFRLQGNVDGDSISYLNNLTKSEDNRVCQLLDDPPVTIPCEYCGLQCDSDFIIQHQTGCDGYFEEETGSNKVTTVADPVTSKTPPKTPKPPPAQNLLQEAKKSKNHQADPDTDMEYLEELFLKEAIENSLREDSKRNNVIQPEEEPVKQQGPKFTSKVRQVPIRVAPNYTPIKIKPEQEAVNDLREIKGIYSTPGSSLVTRTRPSNQMLSSNKQHADSKSQDANSSSGRRNEPTELLGARPKSYTAKSLMPANSTNVGCRNGKEDRVRTDSRTNDIHDTSTVSSTSRDAGNAAPTSPNPMPPRRSRTKSYQQ